MLVIITKMNLLLKKYLQESKKLYNFEEYTKNVLLKMPSLECPWFWESICGFGLNETTSHKSFKKRHSVTEISCLTGLESAVRQLTIFVFICKTD